MDKKTRIEFIQKSIWDSLTTEEKLALKQFFDLGGTETDYLNLSLPARSYLSDFYGINREDYL